MLDGRSAGRSRAASVARAARPARRIIAVVAVVLALAGCGAGATPAPSLPPALAPGTYASSAFQPTVAFTVPEGWWIASDSARFFSLQPVTSSLVGIHLFRDPLDLLAAATPIVQSFVFAAD